MAINTSKVVVGGLAAGVVMSVLSFVGWMPIGARMAAEMDAVAAGTSAKMESTLAMALAIGGQFVLGILLVWLYAAMRPRFGAGFKTAAYAALAIWICGFVFYQGWYVAGMMSGTTYLLASIINFIILLAGGYVGGLLYKEEGSDAPAMASARA